MLPERWRKPNRDRATRRERIRRTAYKNTLQSRIKPDAVWTSRQRVLENLDQYRAAARMILDLVARLKI